MTGLSHQTSFVVSKWCRYLCASGSDPIPLLKGIQVSDPFASKDYQFKEKHMRHTLVVIALALLLAGGLRHRSPRHRACRARGRGPWFRPRNRARQGWQRRVSNAQQIRAHLSDDKRRARHRRLEAHSDHRRSPSHRQGGQRTNQTTAPRIPVGASAPFRCGKPTPKTKIPSGGDPHHRVSA